MLITRCDQVIPALYPDYLAAIQEAMGRGISPEGLDSIHDHKAKHVHKQTRYIKEDGTTSFEKPKTGSAIVAQPNNTYNVLTATRGSQIYERTWDKEECLICGQSHYTTECENRVVHVTDSLERSRQNIGFNPRLLPVVPFERIREETNFGGNNPVNYYSSIEMIPKSTVNLSRRKRVNSNQQRPTRTTYVDITEQGLLQMKQTETNEGAVYITGQNLTRQRVRERGEPFSRPVRAATVSTRQPRARAERRFRDSPSPYTDLREQLANEWSSLTPQQRTQQRRAQSEQVEDRFTRIPHTVLENPPTRSRGASSRASYSNAVRLRSRSTTRGQRRNPYV